VGWPWSGRCHWISNHYWPLGSVILLLCDEDKALSRFCSRKKETVAVACWYLCYIRCRLTHNELVLPMHQCKILVFTIVANTTKAMAKVTGPKSSWERPCPRHVEVKVDGSTFFGYTYTICGCGLKGLLRKLSSGIDYLLTKCSFCKNG
jgi:hypothetical protein